MMVGARVNMSPKGPARPERSFGVTVGGVAVVAAAYLWWRGSAPNAAIVGATGVVLIGLGLFAPRALYWPSFVWWKLVHALGYINARVILTLLFTVLLVPISLFWRLTGKDPLGRRRASGWSPYPARYRDPKHYLRMY